MTPDSTPISASISPPPPNQEALSARFARLSTPNRNESVRTSTPIRDNSAGSSTPIAKSNLGQPSSPLTPQILRSLPAMHGQGGKQKNRGKAPEIPRSSLDLDILSQLLTPTGLPRSEFLRHVKTCPFCLNIVSEDLFDLHDCPA